MKSDLPAIHGYVFKRIIRGSHKNLFDIKTITWKEYKPDATPVDYITKGRHCEFSRNSRHVIIRSAGSLFAAAVREPGLICSNL